MSKYFRIRRDERQDMHKSAPKTAQTNGESLSPSRLCRDAANPSPKNAVSAAAGHINLCRLPHSRFRRFGRWDNGPRTTERLFWLFEIKRGTPYPRQRIGRPQGLRKVLKSRTADRRGPSLTTNQFRYTRPINSDPARKPNFVSADQRGDEVPRSQGGTRTESTDNIASTNDDSSPEVIGVPTNVHRTPTTLCDASDRWPVTTGLSTNGLGYRPSVSTNLETIPSGDDRNNNNISGKFFISEISFWAHFSYTLVFFVINSIRKTRHFYSPREVFV